MTAVPMFDVPAVPVAEPVKLSADARRTARHQAWLAIGVHPATFERVWADIGETCGTCRHHVTHTRNRTYHKCDVHRLGLSGSAASDIRVGWPACIRWEPIPGATDG